jgi:cytochrome c556
MEIPAKTSRSLFADNAPARSAHHIGAQVFFAARVPGSLPKPISNPRSSLMKPGLSLIVMMFLLVGLMRVAARAQSDTDYKEWMKQVNGTNGKLKKELKGKSSDAADDATKMAGLFAQIGDFWQTRKADDAVKFAGDSASSYKQIATLASAGKFDEASAELKSSEANCSGCHKVHRSITIHGAEIK